jgi:methylmalonyl-CoA mutase
MAAKRLSTAFDSVTLYGEDPHERPDIYGKVGNSGVSIATLDDMKVLYDGFDLCNPTTSVSMTINGPAPTILAMFMNTAIDQQIDRSAPTTAASRPPTRKRRSANGCCQRARHGAGRHPEGRPGPEHLHLLDRVLAQGDGRHPGVLRPPQVRNFYSVSISAITSPKPARTRSASWPSRWPTASPMSRPTWRAACTSTTSRPTCRSSSATAWTRNTPCWAAWRAASGRWRCATSTAPTSAARSSSTTSRHRAALHAQEIDFNDIRTTLQALIAIYDNCNSLHTNAYDEAITTPTEESVRRALAIQLIINREWGLAKNENPNQGASSSRN